MTKSRDAFSLSTWGWRPELKHSGPAKASLPSAASHWPYVYVFETGFCVAQDSLYLAV